MNILQTSISRFWRRSFIIYENQAWNSCRIVLSFIQSKRLNSYLKIMTSRQCPDCFTHPIRSINLIENAQSKLEKWAYDTNPNIWSLTGEKDTVRATMIKALEEGCERTEKEYVIELIKSMNNQIIALKNTNTWYTRC